MIDIFDKKNENVAPTWMKFVNPEDSIQGTYVGKIVGQRDSYNNEQVIYLIKKEDGTVYNVGFGLNKKFLIRDMESVKFGQIIGFKFKGLISVLDKRKNRNVEVKDFGLFQDPKIVDEQWLRENKDSMPNVIVSSGQSDEGSEVDGGNEAGGGNNYFGDYESVTSKDVPFSSDGSLTNDDKLALIKKMVKDKYNETDDQKIKDLVMEKTGIAFIPLQYDKIIEELSSKTF